MRNGKIGIGETPGQRAEGIVGADHQDRSSSIHDDGSVYYGVVSKVQTWEDAIKMVRHSKPEFAHDTRRWADANHPQFAPHRVVAVKLQLVEDGVPDVGEMKKLWVVMRHQWGHSFAEVALDTRKEAEDYMATNPIADFTLEEWPEEQLHVDE